MEKSKLENLIKEGYSQYQIADKLNISQSNVRYWFKKFDLKTLKILNQINGVKYCPKCEKDKKLCEFYKRRNNKNTSAYCIDCTKNQSKNRHNDFKKILVEYKGGCCERCGYDKYIGALDFHHLDSKDKIFNLAKLKTYRLNTMVKKELSKCILICANCHREIHSNF